MTNELLVVRCQLGEREALAELVRAWHTPLWTYIRRMMGPAAAEDVTQEVWLSVLRGLPRLHEPARFTPWLFTIARRAVTNRLREEYARPEVFSDTDMIEHDPMPALADRVDLTAALADIPAREREILVLFYLEDLSLEVCAQICEIPVGTVKSRLSRARRILREEMTQKGYRL
jgi:RNA polymerase sigma factor (sigma-70 family)